MHYTTFTYLGFNANNTRPKRKRFAQLDTDGEGNYIFTTQLLQKFI